MPLRSLSARPWRTKRWLVLAPHPDDETLGTGALIAQTAATGHLAAVVYLTDGSASHPQAIRGKLVSTRKQEAALALRRLCGHQARPPLFLDWRDASPAAPADIHFRQSCRLLSALCVRLRVDVLATTAAQEPHCDHAAAAEMAQAVQNATKRPLVLADYIVWGEPPSSRTHQAITTGVLLPGLRRKALSAHRSQLTASHGPGFRLPKDQRAMRPRDTLFIRR